MKMSIIDGLTKSVKSRVSTKSKMKSAFGSWSSDESAEELIDLIQNSRNTNREIEKL
jgi:hypothetical protein